MYRIITDVYCGYKIQKKRWWFPFWCAYSPEGRTNTYSTLTAAADIVERHINRKVCMVIKK